MAHTGEARQLTEGILGLGTLGFDRESGVLFVILCFDFHRYVFQVSSIDDGRLMFNSISLCKLSEIRHGIQKHL